MLLKHEEMEISICQWRLLPLKVDGWLNTGPTPPARVIDHPKRPKPMTGAMKALARNHHLSLWIGTQMVGKESSQ
jgi:hypothetical protein